MLDAAHDKPAQTPSRRSASGALPAAWLSAASLVFMAAVAAGQGPSPAAELYRCHDANGVIALVSRPTPELRDCALVWNGGAVNAPTAAAGTTRPPPDRSSPPVPSSPPAASAPAAKAEDPHEARLREEKIAIVQWCQDHQPPNPKASAKDKAKSLDQCVQDKFGTYMLLNP